MSYSSCLILLCSCDEVLLCSCDEVDKQTHTPCPAQIHPLFPPLQKSHSSPNVQPHIFSAALDSSLVSHTPSPPGGETDTLPFFFKPREPKSASSISDTDWPMASLKPCIGVGDGPFLRPVSLCKEHRDEGDDLPELLYFRYHA